MQCYDGFMEYFRKFNTLANNNLGPTRYLGFRLYSQMDQISRTDFGTSNQDDQSQHKRLKPH